MLRAECQTLWLRVWQPLGTSSGTFLGLVGDVMFLLGITLVTERPQSPKWLDSWCRRGGFECWVVEQGKHGNEKEQVQGGMEMGICVLF